MRLTALARAKPSAQESEVAHVFAPWVAKKLVRRSNDGHACPSWEPEQSASMSSLDAWHSAEVLRRNVPPLEPTCPPRQREAARTRRWHGEAPAPSWHAQRNARHKRRAPNVLLADSIATPVTLRP